MNSYGFMGKEMQSFKKLVYMIQIMYSTNKKKTKLIDKYKEQDEPKQSVEKGRKSSTGQFY